MQLRFLLLLLMYGASLVAYSQPALVRLESRVTDLTGTLQRSEIEALATTLARFEKETSTQIAVLVVATTAGESVEEYAIRIAHENRIGTRENDNGVLLLVAIEDRQIRIEVGYGLEGVIPDLLAHKIITSEILPLFKRGEYYEGILAGVSALMAASRNEYTAKENAKEDDQSILPFLVFLLVVALLFSQFRKKHFRGGMGRGTIGGFPYGGRGGSSWGSSGSGGGFRPGGGSFGGGGASGRW